MTKPEYDQKRTRWLEMCGLALTEENAVEFDELTVQLSVYEYACGIDPVTGEVYWESEDVAS